MRITKTITEYACDICGKICSENSDFKATLKFNPVEPVGVAICFRTFGTLAPSNDEAICQMCINKAVKAYIKQEGIDVNA